MLLWVYSRWLTVNDKCKKRRSNLIKCYSKLDKRCAIGTHATSCHMYQNSNTMATQFKNKMTNTSKQGKTMTIDD